MTLNWISQNLIRFLEHLNTHSSFFLFNTYLLMNIFFLLLCLVLLQCVKHANLVRIPTGEMSGQCVLHQKKGANLLDLS